MLFAGITNIDNFLFFVYLKNMKLGCLRFVIIIISGLHHLHQWAAASLRAVG